MIQFCHLAYMRWQNAKTIFVGTLTHTKMVHILPSA